MEPTSDTMSYISVFDVVRSKSCSKIGLVTAVANEVDDWYDSCLVSPDHIEVQWDDVTNRKCVNRNDVTLVTKFHTLGRCVASVLNPFGQCGVVIGVNIWVDLLTPDGSILEDVNTNELFPVKEISRHRLVQLGSWIGRVYYFIDNVTVLFDNGSVCEFIEANEMTLKPIDNLTKIDRVFPNYPDYYPGQRVKAPFISAFTKSPRFLPGLWDSQSLEGTVTKISVESVWVDWFAYADRVGDGFSLDKPDKKQNPKTLELLSYFFQPLWLCFESCRLKNVEGVFKIINVKKKVDVTWQDGTTEIGLESCTLIEKQDTTFQFFPQQFVKMKNTQESNNGCEIGLITSVKSKEKTALVRWQTGGINDEREREVSIYELEIHPKREYFYGVFVGHYINRDINGHPCIGIIIGMENDLINVSWMSGINSKVVPDDIFQAQYFDSVSNLELEESKTFMEKLLCPLVDAMYFHTTKFLSMRSWDIKHFIPFRSKPNVEENESQSYSSSKCFEATRDYSDHHFVCALGQSNARRKWLKKVQKDWRLLQKDLPDGIFVKVYEDRMDILRAMIVGPYGTPYQDGLFFFDFLLPPEYPDVPPVVHYHSGGWKINPNLYEDGKICISLLNTWHGNESEIWDSSSSGILQVLVSIQGLVLNSKPYFNEAGYESLIGSTEGEKDSLSYNENAYLLNCKRMIHVMRHPIKGFEELVREHFIARGYFILKACDGYIKGYEIGCLTKNASPNKSSKRNANSLGFKLTLANKIVPKLFVALEEVGFSCHDFTYLVK